MPINIYIYIYISLYTDLSSSPIDSSEFIKSCYGRWLGTFKTDKLQLTRQSQIKLLIQVLIPSSYHFNHFPCLLPISSITQSFSCQFTPFVCMSLPSTSISFSSSSYFVPLDLFPSSSFSKFNVRMT